MTGGATYVDPVSGRPMRHEVRVESGDPRGFADSAFVARRVGGPTSEIVVDAAGRRVVDVVVAPQRHALVSFEYVPSTGEWRPVSYFPEA